MERKISKQVRGYRTQDGAGVDLVRVLSRRTSEEYDPILLLDSFDSTDPAQYKAGFPMHPHRGIETITYVYHGQITHRTVWKRRYHRRRRDPVDDGGVGHLARRGCLHQKAAWRTAVAEYAGERQDGRSDTTASKTT